MINNRIVDLAVKAGLINYVDNETPRYYFVDSRATPTDVEEFAKLLLKDILDICNRGAETQTTSGGVAILVRQRFGLNEQS